MSPISPRASKVDATEAGGVDRILEVGLGFWPSKVLLTAAELGVFTVLGDKSMTALELGAALRLHPRGIYDFFDALVALDFLARYGNGPEARYANSPATAQFLDKNQPGYIGGILEMASARLFRFWGDLDVALKTGQPQNEIRHSKSMFDTLYEDPARLERWA